MFQFESWFSLMHGFFAAGPFFDHMTRKPSTVRQQKKKRDLCH